MISLLTLTSYTVTAPSNYFLYPDATPLYELSAMWHWEYSIPVVSLPLMHLPPVLHTAARTASVLWTSDTVRPVWYSPMFPISFGVLLNSQSEALLSGLTHLSNLSSFFHTWESYPLRLVYFPILYLHRKHHHLITMCTYKVFPASLGEFLSVFTDSY